MNIGEQIRKYRKEAGLSQKELGQKLGVSQQHIAQYESGKRIPKLETINKIAGALNMGIDNIIKQSQDILNDLSSHPENWVQENPFTGESIPVKQVELLKHYNSLNELGKSKAIERIEELTEIPRYTKPDQLTQE